MLQVAMGGEVISSSVVFEYKARDLPALPSSQHDWLSLDGERKYLFTEEINAFVHIQDERVFQSCTPRHLPECVRHIFE